MFETSAIVQQDLDWQKLTDKQREELGRFFLVQQEEERKMLDQLEKTLEVPKGKSERMIKAETGLSEELKKNMQEAQFVSCREPNTATMARPSPSSPTEAELLNCMRT